MFSRSAGNSFSSVMRKYLLLGAAGGNADRSENHQKSVILETAREREREREREKEFPNL